MLSNGRLFKDEIKKEHLRVWYDEQYQYYFGSYNNSPWFDDEDKGDFNTRVFASLDPKDNSVIGMISYHIDRVANNVTQFAVINYHIDDIRKKVIYGRDVAQVIDDIFVRFNHHKMEWFVIQGNPIEKSYDRLCEQLGGRIIGTITDATVINGRFHNDKMYELMQEDYLKNRHVLKGAKNNG